jgi:hypothetical protein
VALVLVPRVLLREVLARILFFLPSPQLAVAVVEATVEIIVGLLVVQEVVLQFGLLLVQREYPVRVMLAVVCQVDFWV